MTDKNKQLKLLSQELSELFWKIEFVRTLFYHSERRIDLMNMAAPAFFQLVKRVAVDDLLLSLARLFDRPSHGQGHNLSVRYFVETLGLPNDPSARERINRALERRKGLLRRLKEHRDKTLAHSDVNVLDGDRLAGVTVHEIRRTAQMLGAVYNLLSEDQGRAPTHWGMVLSVHRPEDIIEVIQLGGMVRDALRRELGYEEDSDLPKRDIGEEVVVLGTWLHESLESVGYRRNPWIPMRPGQ